jgi:hypothetical protein
VPTPPGSCVRRPPGTKATRTAGRTCPSPSRTGGHPAKPERRPPIEQASGHLEQAGSRPPEVGDRKLVGGAGLVVGAGRPRGSATRPAPHQPARPPRQGRQPPTGGGRPKACRGRRAPRSAIWPPGTKLRKNFRKNLKRIPQFRATPARKSRPAPTRDKGDPDGRKDLSVAVAVADWRPPGRPKRRRPPRTRLAAAHRRWATESLSWAQGAHREGKPVRRPTNPHAPLAKAGSRPPKVGDRKLVVGAGRPDPPSGHSAQNCGKNFRENLKRIPQFRATPLGGGARPSLPG